jgi:hypothetical protein
MSISTPLRLNIGKLDPKSNQRKYHPPIESDILTSSHPSVIESRKGECDPKLEGIRTEIRSGSGSTCVEQVADLHQTLRTPFLGRRDSQPPGTRNRLLKSKGGSIDNPISRKGWNILRVDLCNRLGIRAPRTSIDEIIRAIYLFGRPR